MSAVRSEIRATCYILLGSNAEMRSDGKDFGVSLSLHSGLEHMPALADVRKQLFCLSRWQRLHENTIRIETA
jgi:hypothetical protein